MGPPLGERELVRQLVTSWHLNVPERRALPGGRVRASLVYDAIEEVLESVGRFPSDWQPDDSFSGGVIEAGEDGSCRITWKAEVSMMHHEAIAEEHYRSRREAVAAFVKRFFGGDIDGIPIDWSS